MKIYQIIAVLTILLHATSCTDFCQSIFKTDDNTCKDYINETEQTLLRRKGNLLVLNDAFYPSHDYAKPNLLVDYFTETYREKGNIVEQYKTRGYCQSNTYTVISPVMLQTLFTGILYLFSREIGRQEKGYIRIHLQQDISHIKLTENQIDFLVDYITPWVSQYI